MQLEDTRQYVEERLGDHHLLYLSVFGSHLYGTTTQHSDVDYKGVFLPSRKSLLLMEGDNIINLNSNGDQEKNGSGDRDIQLWSLHYFLQGLLARGEIESVDLLFSVNNPDGVAYSDGSMERLHAQRHRLFDPAECSSYTGYCRTQARKYGMKGSRVDVLQNVLQVVNNHLEYLQNLDIQRDHALSHERLRDIREDILKHCEDDIYCFPTRANNESALCICDKIHMLSIPLGEFLRRIQAEWNKYGKRAMQARENGRIDWKSLSHAYRAVLQMKELLSCWDIRFPLSDPDGYMLAIKRGELPWQETESLIAEGLKEVYALQEKSGRMGEHDEDFVKDFILDRYAAKTRHGL